MAATTNPWRPERKRDPAADSIRAIVERERRALEEESRGTDLGERISKFVGSRIFVLLHVALFAGWPAWNALASDVWRFDPYPYRLLRVIVSLEGVLLATFVLIKQNRMSQRSEKRAHLQLQTDVVRKQQLTLLRGMLRRIAARHPISTKTKRKLERPS